MRSLIASCLVLSAISFASSAFADEPSAAGPPKPGDTAPAQPAGAASAPTQPTGAAAAPGTDPAAGQPASKKPFDEGFSPTDEEAQRKKKEDANKTQWFLGARFRDFIVPAFLFHMFAKGGPTNVNIFTSGPELTMRSGNLEVDFSFTVPYADFSMKEFMFKAKNDPDAAYEKVSADLKIFQASVDILGNIPFDKERRFSMLIGGGIGIGGVAGNIYRNQAYPKDPNKINPADPKQWNKCVAAGNPDVKAQNGNGYCDASNNHYGNYTEPSWANGGSKPFIFPYVVLPQLGFRVQPVKILQIRADTGFSITGFFVGLSMGLKLPT